jgi:hypothetical protein
MRACCLFDDFWRAMFNLDAGGYGLDWGSDWRLMLI